MEAPSILRNAHFTAGDLSARARAVAAIAANNAIDVDAASRFPAEACAALKEQRLLGVMVSRDLGGEGASIADVADVCYQLGQACSSTAMIYAMHQIKVACVTRHMRDNAVLAGTMRRLCDEQLLLASSTTEGQAGGNVRSSEAPVEHVDGGIQLERKASVISYGAYADGIVTTARRSADAPGSDQVLVAFLKSDYTLTRLQGWNTLGMRGTCSEGYTLKAQGQAGQILPEPYETIHAQTMVPFAHLLWGSVWTGIAASATARAQAFIRQAMRTSNGQLAARCAAVHAGAEDPANAAWDVGHLPAHLRAQHERPEGTRLGRLPVGDYTDESRGFGACCLDRHERDACLRALRLPCRR